MDKGDPGQGTREATAGVSNVLTSPVSSSTVLKFENWLYIYIFWQERWLNRERLLPTSLMT